MTVEVVPTFAVIPGGGSFSYGMLNMVNDEFVSFGTLVIPPDPNIPGRSFMHWNAQGFNRPGTYTGDIEWTFHHDIKQRRRFSEEEVCVFVFENNPGTTIPLDVGFGGRILVGYP